MNISLCKTISSCAYYLLPISAVASFYGAYLIVKIIKEYIFFGDLSKIGLYCAVLAILIGIIQIIFRGIRVVCKKEIYRDMWIRYDEMNILYKPQQPN